MYSQENIATLKEAFKEIANEIINVSVKGAITEITKEVQQDLLKAMRQNNNALNKRMSKIIERQQYHILISSVMPLIAEPLRQYFINIFNTNQPPRSTEEFMKQMEPISKDIAPGLKNKIYEVASVFFNEKNKENNE